MDCSIRQSPVVTAATPTGRLSMMEASRLFVTITDLSENYPPIVPDSAYES